MKKGSGTKNKSEHCRKDKVYPDKDLYKTGLYKKEQSQKTEVKGY